MTTDENVLRELTALLLPPPLPVATGSRHAWGALESRLGIRLPSDYKWFISTYGAGRLEEFVWILSPFEPPAGHGTLEAELAAHRAWHATGLVEGEPDGLIPWALNEDRGTCFWETNEHDPDRWTVLQIIEDDIRRWPENMTTFLLKVLKGDHVSDVFSHLGRYTPPLHYKSA